jgi:uncharacterized protein YndB with AHSA1/START domain
MSKIKFIQEYPINASPKMIYPYLSTASGLAQWFCDDVRVNEDKIYNFIWDEENHFAEMSSHRLNRSVRFVFLGDDKQHIGDPPYVDFCIETGELTQEQFLRIIDYSNDGDQDQLTELWDNLIQNLREIIGG